MTTNAKSYKEALDELIDAETAADILNEETQTRAVARLQEYLGDMGIHEDYNQVESDAIDIAQKMFDDINKNKSKYAKTKKLETTNNIILEAIDNLVLAATGEYPRTKETWKYCGHDSVTLREAIEDIESHQGFITPENKRLFIAAYIAIDALNEYQ